MGLFALLVGLATAVPSLLGYRAFLRRAFPAGEGGGVRALVRAPVTTGDLGRALLVQGLFRWARTTVRAVMVAVGATLLTGGLVGMDFAVLAVVGSAVGLGLPIVLAGGALTVAATLTQQRLESALVVQSRLRDPGAGHVALLPPGSSGGELGPLP